MLYSLLSSRTNSAKHKTFQMYTFILDLFKIKIKDTHIL